MSFAVGKTLVQRYAFAPEEIEQRSFTIIADLLSDFDQSVPEWQLVQRIVHTTGDPSLGRHILVHPRAITAGIRALREGCPIITDVKMVAAGISRRMTTRLGCQVVCAIDDPAVLAMAEEEGTTRSIAAMRHLASSLAGTIVAIGNAPTALLALLDQLDAGYAAPALIVGTPVGFVAASEAKEELVRRQGVPYVTAVGTRGGSAIAAAAVNALLRMV